MSHDNVCEWLLEQGVFQLLLKSRQRIGRRDIVRQHVPLLPETLDRRRLKVNIEQNARTATVALWRCAR